MRKPALGLLLLGGLLGATMGTHGCAPPPASEDALLYYMEIARYNGKVRRAWPAGQAYLDRVMQYDVALDRKLGLLGEMRTPESLWANADPRWKDREALEKHVSDLEKRLDEPQELLDSTEDLKEVDALLRRELMERIGEALDDVPEELPFTSDAAKADFVRRAWDALAGGRASRERAISWLEARVRERLVLYREVLAEIEQFDTTRPGLHVLDAGLDVELNSHLMALRTDMAAVRARFIEYAQLRLRVLEPQVVQTDKRTERAEYELLSSERQYWRDELAGIPKDVNDAATAAEKRLKQAKKQLKQANAEESRLLEAEVAFCEARIEELRAQQRELEQRIGAILERADADAAEAASDLNDD